MVDLDKNAGEADVSPEVLGNADNASVLAYLHDLSAHSDVVAALENAVAPLGDAQILCPDASQFRYVAVATREVIFGFAAGMDSIGFRLEPELKARALATGAGNLAEAGPEWVVFTVFRSDWPEPDLRFWARSAYVHAREDRQG
jgi:hypothetical protein